MQKKKRCLEIATREAGLDSKAFLSSPSQISQHIVKKREIVTTDPKQIMRFIDLKQFATAQDLA